MLFVSVRVRSDNDVRLCGVPEKLLAAVSHNGAPVMRASTAPHSRKCCNHLLFLVISMMVPAMGMLFLVMSMMVLASGMTRSLLRACYPLPRACCALRWAYCALRLACCALPWACRSLHVGKGYKGSDFFPYNRGDAIETWKLLSGKENIVQIGETYK